MDKRFIEACFNKRHQCVGLSLQPYSLSHILVLESIGSPFVESGTRATPHDMGMAAFICSRQWYRGARWWRGRSPERFHTHKPGVYTHAWIGAMKRNPYLCVGELFKFGAYMDDYLQLPEFWSDPEIMTGREATGPYLLAKATSVMLHFPQITEEDAWTMPVGLLAWYDGQAQEHKHDRRFYGDEAEEEIEAGLQLAESQITPEMRERARQIKESHSGHR